MRALVLPKYGAMAASTRHRFLQYLPALRDAGIDCDVRPLFDDEYLARKFDRGETPYWLAAAAFARRIRILMRTASYRVVVVHCELFPYLPRWFERLVTRHRVPYVLDLDDAIFHQYDEHASRSIRWLYGNKIKRVSADAALVMAGNEYLAAYARQTAKQVEVVPTVVDLQKYVIREGLPGTSSEFTIGWIGSPSTAPYLEGIADSLRAVCSEEGCRLVLVGAGQLKLPGVRAEMRKWSEATEVNDISGFDVGIMPLPDTPWARGKCGFKLIQYMACGVPVVASPVGVNRALVEDGVGGFLAKDVAEWTKALRTLRQDPRLRHSMGRSGRLKVERSYSLQALRERVVALLQEAAKADPRTTVGSQ